VVTRRPTSTRRRPRLKQGLLDNHGWAYRLADLSDVDLFVTAPATVPF
jgi:hypothetical protein